MTKRLRSIVTFTICSLGGVLLLQVYFGYQVYQQHTTALEREVDRALQEASATAESQRIDQINALFAQDISNPDLVKLSLSIEDGEQRIMVADPVTGNNHVSIKFRERADSATLVQQMIDDIIKYNRNFLEERSVMYWTDKIGERLSRYSDSIQISRKTLTQEIRRELDTIDIFSDFQLILSQDTTSTPTPGGFSIGAREASVTIEGHDVVSVELTQPAREVLRRSGFVYLMTIIVLLLIVGSFLVLLRFVRRQKRLSQLKDEFIDNVTHELLTPITTLKLALGTMRQHQTSDTPNRYLDMSEQQAQRIAEVVDHILQVSFIDEKQAGLQIEEVSLNALLGEVITYHEITSQRPLEITTVTPNNDYAVQTDRKHLVNVFHNLIGNAIKHGPESGTKLKIEVKEQTDSLQMDFTDSGPGIPPQEHKNIFEKFHRVTNGQTHEVKGLGIGLYYARGIMDRLGGSLKLMHSSPEGSVFSLTLPYQKVKY